ncbi:MAG: glucokinase [Hydrogenophilales bacterium 28-61-23]|nr:MAG: glucokinase [Hydrogenophilales bacterium 28-61-23]
MHILVGDLGGTHTRLALAELDTGRVGLARVARYINSEHADLNAILAHFLAAGGAAGELACCLAVAGPTDGLSVQFTNLDWRIETAALTTQFGFADCRLINDFAAIGWGLNTLAPDALATLQSGQALAGAAVALGAGTGLGVSLCVWRDDHYRPLPSEGGHVAFAPCNAEQDRLLAHLRPLYGRVSVERILSGPGLLDLFRFCLREAGRDNSPLLESPHPAAAISQAGLDRTDPAALHCLHLFAEIYGQTAGDWALATQARGGIFLAGGIAPKLLPVLQSSVFLDAFNRKGRYSAWMSSVPVSVILDPDIGLKGAAFAASNLGAHFR